MRIKELSMLVLAGLLLGGCAGTPKVSHWTSPPERHLTVVNVFDAAMFAGVENKFTVINSDRQAGVISMKQETYGGDHKNNERRMSVRMKELNKNTVEVRTKVSGSDFGIIEGLLGGLVHKEITNNFYVYLFRELNISDPNQKQVMIVDENALEVDRGRTQAVTKETAPTRAKTEDQPMMIQAQPVIQAIAQPVSQPASQPVAQQVEKKSESSVTPQSFATSPSTTVVIESKTKLRKSPSKKASVIKTLKKGEEVQVIKQKDEWCLVELAGGETGWCVKSSLAQRN